MRPNVRHGETTSRTGRAFDYLLAQVLSARDAGDLDRMHGLAEALATVAETSREREIASAVQAEALTRYAQADTTRFN